MKKMLARYPLGNPRRKWRQDNFIISVLQPGPMGLDHGGPLQCQKARQGMQTVANAGFNRAEMCWASPEIGMEMVRMAERLELPIAYQNLFRFGGMGYRKDKNLPPENNDLEGVLRDLAPWKYVQALFLYDEPITSEQRALTRDLIGRTEELRPDMFPYICSDAKEIDVIADEIDPPQLSFDQYPFGGAACSDISPEKQMDECGHYWSRMEIGRLAAKRINAPYWFIYQGHELPYKPVLDNYTFTASRMMANAALLYGAKGLSCYIECDGVLDPQTGGRGIYFEEQKKLNRELAMLGNTLMALECQRVIHDESVKSDSENVVFQTMNESELLSGALPHRISISELKDSYGNDYLMVLNRDYRNAVRYSLTMKKAMRVWRVGDKDGQQNIVFDDLSRKIPGTLEAGSIALYRLQPKEEEPCAIEYYLEKAQQI